MFFLLFIIIIIIFFELLFFRMLLVVLAAITTPFVSPVLQGRDIDAYVLLDLRKLIVNKVGRKNVFVPVFCLQQKLLAIHILDPTS